MNKNIKISPSILRDNTLSDVALEILAIVYNIGCYDWDLETLRNLWKKESGNKGFNDFDTAFNELINKKYVERYFSGDRMKYLFVDFSESDKFFYFLKDLHEKIASNSSFFLRKFARKYSLDELIQEELINGGLICKSKERNKFIWKTTVIPNIKMAEELSIRYKKALKLRDENIVRLETERKRQNAEYSQYGTPRTYELTQKQEDAVIETEEIKQNLVERFGNKRNTGGFDKNPQNINTTGLNRKSEKPSTSDKEDLLIGYVLKSVMTKFTDLTFLEFKKIINKY